MSKISILHVHHIILVQIFTITVRIRRETVVLALPHQCTRRVMLHGTIRSDDVKRQRYFAEP